MGGSAVIGCANCGRPAGDHCRIHLVPCCPGRCRGHAAVVQPPSAEGPDPMRYEGKDGRRKRAERRAARVCDHDWLPVAAADLPEGAADPPFRCVHCGAYQASGYFGYSSMNLDMDSNAPGIRFPEDGECRGPLSAAAHDFNQAVANFAADFAIHLLGLGIRLGQLIRRQP